MTTFQSLPDRMAGLPLDEALHDGVPHWLGIPLQQWLTIALDGDERLARRVLIRLRWSRPSLASDSALLSSSTGEKLLAAVDALLQLHPGWDWPVAEGGWGEYGPVPGWVEWLQDRLADLEQLLVDGGSLYTVDPANHCLTRRVDPTVAQAVAATIDAAEPTTAGYLRTAWAAAYGLDPDTDKAYDEAVLAVEALACPLVCPTNPRRTLGTVIADLGNQRARWALAIGDSTGQPAGPDRLIEMLQLLWQGQSRHAGSANSRRQTQAEAEAAVHLAVTLVQWFTAGVLYRR